MARYFKKFFICLSITFSTIIILTLAFTTFNYLNLISTKVLNVIKILIPLFSAILGSYFFGKKAKKNGWLEGIKFGSALFIIFIIIDIILDSLSKRSIIFCIIVMFCAILGSIVGINKKE